MTPVALTDTDDGPGSLLQDCYFHRVCGGLVVPGETVCDICRRAWGDLLRPRVSAPTRPSPASGSRGRGVAAATPAPQTRRNQTCWLCEQTRKCTDTPSGWECTPCMAIT